MYKASTSVLPILISSFLISTASASVNISVGPSPIPNSDANHEKDITIQNEHLAFSLAIESAAPWGVPRGTLVDLAAVQDGEIGLDRIAFADFIPNSWSGWPNTYKKVDIKADTSDKAVVKISRDFGEVEISTWYTLKSGSDTIELKTVMTNHGEQTLDLESGFTLWPDSGYLFAVPGLDAKKESRAENALTDRMVGYDKDWAIALHAPYFDRIKYDSRDMYLGHTLAPKESRSFNAYLQMVNNGDLTPVVAQEARRKGQKTGLLQGAIVANNGTIPETAIVMIEKNGHPYAWARTQNGHYQIELPIGKYDIYGTAEGHAKSVKESVEVYKNDTITLNFDSLRSPAKVLVNVKESSSEHPIDARITIEQGQKQPVEFLGKRTFFTELLPVGYASLELAPGNYQLGINAGAGFLSEKKVLSLSLESNQTQEHHVNIEQITFPNKYNWYGADLHHHANVLEGVTDPETVIRAQLATGLDFTFISDHDSTVNYETFAKLSAKRNIPFIPSIEISPSWGHINPFPLNLDSELTVDPGTDDVHTIIDAAFEMGAEVIPMNHPYNDYGYFTNLEKGAVPGGATDRFDLMELNSMVDNTKTLKKAHQLWDQGIPMYFTAGTDTHDAWNTITGNIRMMAHVENDVTPRNFAKALKAGKGYATEGPILYPKNIMFGGKANIGDIWKIDLIAVDGIKEVRMISKGGQVINTLSIDSEDYKQHLSLSLKISEDIEKWVSLEIEDIDGSTAWTNPIWIK